MLAQAITHKGLDVRRRWSASAACPGAGTMKAFTTKPRNASGTPMTATAWTAGCPRNGLLDLDRAHGPAGRYDHVIRTAGVVEIPVRIDATAILCREPGIVTAHLDLAKLPWRAARAVRSLHLDLDAGNRAAERAFLDREVGGTRVIGQNDADLGRPVHAAQRRAERILDERRGFTVDRLAGERQFLKCRPIIPNPPGVLDHPVVGGGGRQIGRTVVLQRFQQALGLEFPSVRARLDPKRQRRKRAVPEAVTPGRRGRAEESVARPQTGPVQCRVHHHHHRAVRVPDGFRHFPGGA